MATSDTTVQWLSRADPLEVFAWLAGTVMLVIALAQWLASYRADRRALRIFSARYAVAGLTWWFSHPGVQPEGAPVPMLPAVLAVVLLGVTVWALDEFLGRSTPARRARIAAGAALGIVFVLAWRQWRPADPVAVFSVMVVMTGVCALMAWRAARDEPGVGHRVVALAFASYPVVMVAAAFHMGWDSRGNLSYLAALPGVIVGVAVLSVSLMRSALRAQREAQRREAAEAHLAQLNASLEHRVQERTAELQLLVDGLESFARTISHDLRGSIGGAASLSRLAIDAIERGDTARAAYMLGVIAPQLEHMSTLVRDLLRLARLDDAAIEPTVQPLGPLVRQALDQLAIDPEHAEPLQRVEVEVGELPQWAVDATLLRQVFVNLLSNALRFATRSAQAPAVRIGTAATGDGASAVYVEDNGPGFPPDAAGRLFEPFVRLHEGALSHHGIGLSIVRRIVERHGGRVWAECRPGRGAVFWMALPPAGAR